MNKKTIRNIFFATMIIGAVVVAIPSNTVMPTNVVNLAFFYKPPNNGTAVEVAQNFDVVILTHKDEPFRDQLIANGFSSTIMQYLRFEAIMDPGNCTSEPLHNQVAYKPGDFCAISRDHPDWFLLDAAGNRLMAEPAWYVMDPGHPGWRAFWLARAIEMQTAFGWSALFMDNVEANLGLRRNASGIPAKYPDSASYQTAIRGFLEYLYINYARAYNRPIFANITSYRYEQDVWFSYLSFLDGALMETWSVDWVSNNNYLDKTRWEYELDWAEKTQNLGKQIILVASGYQADTDRQKFSFASYLLISNGKAAFRYARSGNYTQVWQYDNYQVDLGSPLGPRYQSGGVWRRDFAKGFVTVDPVNHTATISTNPPPTVTHTATPTSTATRTPTSTMTITSTPTFTPIPKNICILVTWERGLNLRPAPSMFNAPYRYINFGMGATFPVEQVFVNDEGIWMQINKNIYSAMYLISNDKTYAVETPCQ